MTRCIRPFALGVFGLLATAAGADEPKSPPLEDVKSANALAYSADGSFLIIDLTDRPRRSDDTLGVWDTKTGKCRVMLEKSHSSWERLAVSADGKKAAAVSVGQQEVKVWEVVTGKLVETQKLPKWSGSALSAMFLAFSPDDDQLYSTFDKRVLEVKLGGKNQFIAEKLSIESPAVMSFDPKLKRLVLVRTVPRANKSDLVVHDLGKGGEPTSVALEGRVGALAMSHDGKTLALSFGGVPGKARLELWDTDGLKRRATWAADKREGFAGYRQLLFAPDDKTLAGSPTFAKPPGQIVTFLDLDGKIVSEAAGPTATDQMEFSPDGKTLAVRLLDLKHSLLFIDPTTGEAKKP